MLNINKIISKKIYFTLSLRAFPHVIARGRNDRSNLNLNGFSLIELMVAVAILAMAILGIFHAYSVGFMGMADSRDRTVAVNYLQEALEDFKNMDFNKINDKAITLIPGTKYHMGSIVIDLEKQGDLVTLKKIITQIRWMDRNNNIKTEEVSTLIYKKPASSDVGSTATKLVLYAQSYYTIMPEHEVTLIAEIQDENGNIFDWNGPITFSVITDPVNDPIVGSITTSQPVNAVNGIADCIFTAVSGDNVEGTDRIQASAVIDGNELLDTVNIRVTTGPVGIILEPVTQEDRILPAGIGVVSNINLKVVKADYKTLIEYGSPITLSSNGPGTLSTNTISSVPTDGISFTVTSTDVPGIVEITASSLDLDMGYTEITFTGEPETILVSTKKKSIYPSEETTITVTIVDENNTPVSFGAIGDPKTVIITDDPEEYGTLDNISGALNLTFEGESSKTFVFKAYTKEVLAEYLLPKKITITASDSLSALNPGSKEIEILSPLIAHHIFVSHSPSIVELDLVDEQKFSQIDAIMQDEYNNEIVYGNDIIFETDYGFFFSSGTNTTTLPGGIATAELYPLDGISKTEKATITIYSNNLTPDSEGPPGNPSNPVVIEILFHFESEPHHINLTASPVTVFIGGQTCTLTAKVVDESEVTYSSYNGRVKFTISGDTSSIDYDNLVVYALNGIATLDLATTTAAGTVNITAETLDLISDGFGSEVFSSLTIVNVNDISIELVDDSIFYFDNGKTVMFNIEITGPELDLESMLIEWGYEPSKLTKIEIKSPSTATAYSPVINVANAKTPYTQENINTNLLPGESTIRLTFSTNMQSSSLSVTFITNFGTYEYSPQIIVKE